MNEENAKSSRLENVYNYHHQVERGKGFLILAKERGEFLRSRIGIGKKVLDLGCRDGALTKLYCEGNDVLGVDIDKAALEVAQDELAIKTKKMDLNGPLNLPQNSFDVVVAAEVLEHLYYPEKILRNLVGLLKEGGIILGSIPHAFGLQFRIKFLLGRKRGTTFEDPTHINHFSVNEFKALLKKDFTDIELIPITSKKYFPFSIIYPFLFAHTILFWAKKNNTISG